MDRYPQNSPLSLIHLKIQLDGETTSGTPKTAFDEIFQIDLPFFDQAAQFRQQFKLLDPNAKEISGEINYQACDDRVCIFRTEPFTIMLDGSKVELAKIELTTSDIARSEALTLSFKNKAYLTSSVDESSNSSPYLSLFLLGFFRGIDCSLNPLCFPYDSINGFFFLKTREEFATGNF